LGTSVPVLVAKAKGEKIKVGIKSNAGRGENEVYRRKPEKTGLKKNYQINILLT